MLSILILHDIINYTITAQNIWNVSLWFF